MAPLELRPDVARLRHGADGGDMGGDIDGDRSEASTRTSDGTTGPGHGPRDGSGNGAENRAALRQRTFKTGRVVVKGVQTMECVIRNMSLTGARIVITNNAALPDRFDLFIGDEGMHREVEVMSRSPSSAGLRFLKPLSARELGAEFMSLKASAQYRNERARAVVDAPALDTAPKPTEAPAAIAMPPDASPRLAPEPPEPVGAHAPDLPVAEYGTIEATPAIPRIRHRALPGALTRHLRWS